MTSRFRGNTRSRRDFLQLLALGGAVSLGPRGAAGAAALAAGPIFEEVPPSASGVSWVHENAMSSSRYLPETMGPGVAFFDFDNDGWTDIFLVNSGASDFYTPATPLKNALYRNNRDGTFSDVTAAAGVAGPATEWSTSTGFIDVDRDGFLDLYVVNYLDYRPSDNPYCGDAKPGYRMYCHPTMFDGVADRLYRNNGNGTFTDISKASGIANPAGKGLGVAFCDYDRDGLTDIYVANDTVRNFLYRNTGKGTFVDEAYGAGVGFDANGKPQAGMGTDCADVDANGLPDIFVTNFSEELNTLYQNKGGGIFEDVTVKAGLGSGFTPLGFGTKMFDADNDGDLDIHVTNGHVIDNVKLYRPTLTYAQKDLFYENHRGTFKDITAQSGAALQATRVGRGLAVADFDNDGNLDVVITSLNQRAVLLKNQGAGAGNWIMIRAKGKKSNAFGLGATVTVETTEGRQVREINNAASYVSSNDIRLHVGLGAAKIIRQIEVMWPSGARQILKDVPVNQVLVIEEP